MQIFLKHREGEALHREYAATLAEFDRRLKEYELRMGGADFRRPAERWEDAKGEVRRLVEGAQGLEDDPQFARDMLHSHFEGLRGADPYLVEALRNPQGNAPEAPAGAIRRTRATPQTVTP